MERIKFRFKKELFLIEDIHNIPGLIICCGHGYDFKTYCCKNCGEIFVVDSELFFHYPKLNLEILIDNKNCPTCNSPLKNNLEKYPENIYYENRLFKNNNHIDSSNFVDTELIEMYLLN